VDDLLELIWQSRRNNAGITCASDYMYHQELVSPVIAFTTWGSCPLLYIVHARVLR
jgi:hypothetical protein